ncbi:transposase [Oceanispirochaeta sp.]|jgi:hypothetical protein|uniref:transposase n=1 Tax=Oceanispirochaeta sp. TaxID=2035350 RepID=UPI00261F61A8|nr:transposase [Oceanispirochaeta sp.]MDA3955665.1 transposase [Oceanispirochaeta sp.]
MSTGHGVIQGYNGIAAVDDKHQLIIFADTFDTKVRQVAILKEVADKNGRNPIEEMKTKIDTPYGRAISSHRMSTVEPVFGHIAGIKKLNRFTLRGKEKVSTQ